MSDQRNNWLVEAVGLVVWVAAIIGALAASLWMWKHFIRWAIQCP